MFERFTDQARRIVVLAQEEARMLSHPQIGTEHLLLALVREDTGKAAMALGSLGITGEAARRQVEEITGRGQHSPRGHIPMTPGAKKTLELSMREAIALGSDSIGTEHILLALIRDGEGVGARALNGLGADPSRVRRQVIRLVSASRGEGETGVPPTAAEGGKRDKRKRPAEVRDRLNSMQWRLAVLEQRVGAGLDVRDTDARGQEWSALPSLTDEVERLRDLLRRHGIDPRDVSA